MRLKMKSKKSLAAALTALFVGVSVVAVGIIRHHLSGRATAAAVSKLRANTQELLECHSTTVIGLLKDDPEISTALEMLQRSIHDVSDVSANEPSRELVTHMTLAKASVLVARDSWGEAKELLGSLRPETTTCVALWNELQGDVAFGIEQWSSAKSFYDKVVNRGSVRRVSRKAAFCLTKLGQFDAAERMYTQLLDESSSDGQTLIESRLLLKYFYTYCWDSEETDNKLSAAATTLGKLIAVERTIAEASDSESDWLGLASSHSARGSIHKLMGRKERALSDLNEAVAIGRQVATSERTDEILTKLSLYLHNRAIAHSAAEDFSSAIVDGTEAIRLREEKGVSSTSDAFRLATSYLNRGLSHERLGKRQLSTQDISRAIQLLESVEEGDRSLTLNQCLITCLATRAINFKAEGDNESALRDMHQADQLRTAVDTVSLGSLEGVLHDVDFLDKYAHLLRTSGHLPQAVEKYTEAIRVVLQADPTYTVVQLSSAELYNNRALTYGMEELFDEALSDHEESIGVARGVVADDNDWQHRHVLGRFLRNRSMTYADSGQRVQAIESYTEAIDELRLVDKLESRLRVLKSLSAALRERAELWEQREEYARALLDFAQSAEIYKRLVSTETSSDLAHEAVLIHWRTAVNMLRKQTPVKSVKYLEWAVRVGGECNVKEELLARCFNSLGLAQSQCREFSAGQESFDRAIELFGGVSKGKASAEAARAIAICFENKANALIENGDAESALSALGNLIRYRQIVYDFQDSPVASESLAHAYFRRGRLLKEQGFLSKWSADIDRSAELRIENLTRGWHADSARGMAEVHVLRGDVAQGFDEFSDAFQEYEKALDYRKKVYVKDQVLGQLASNSQWLGRQFALCKDESSRDLDKAKHYAKWACELVGFEDEDMLSTLADICALRGELVAALEFQQQAVTKSGASVEMKERLEKLQKLIHQSSRIEFADD